MVDKWRVSSEEKVVNKILKYLMCMYKEKTKYFCIILLQYNYWNHICLFPSSELLLWQFLGEIQFYCTQEPSTLFSTSSVCWESHGWVFFYFFYKHSNYWTLAPPICSVIGWKFSWRRSTAERLFCLKRSCKLDWLYQNLWSRWEARPSSPLKPGIWQHGRRSHHNRRQRARSEVS